MFYGGYRKKNEKASKWVGAAVAIAFAVVIFVLLWTH